MGIAVDHENSEAQKASDSLVRRISFMAAFIAESCPDQFGHYWSLHWKGEAKAGECLDFFRRPELVNEIAVMRKVKI
jgi:hypothetical protein